MISNYFCQCGWLGWVNVGGPWCHTNIKASQFSTKLAYWKWAWQYHICPETIFPGDIYPSSIDTVIIAVTVLIVFDKSIQRIQRFQIILKDSCQNKQDPDQSKIVQLKPNSIQFKLNSTKLGTTQLVVSILLCIFSPGY